MPRQGVFFFLFKDVQPIKGKLCLLLYLGLVITAIISLNMPHQENIMPHKENFLYRKRATEVPLRISYSAIKNLRLL